MIGYTVLLPQDLPVALGTGEQDIDTMKYTLAAAPSSRFVSDEAFAFKKIWEMGLGLWMGLDLERMSQHHRSEGCPRYTQWILREDPD